ncbi:hypothetical protein MMC20_000284 [Loxospora ochrophaea]|nr:hypothetical protein [Loxospora ochrophaea]
MSSPVAQFLSLPRNRLAPSDSVPNHWHFSIRHVPLQPPGDLLFLINPGSRFVHNEGPSRSLADSSPAQRAKWVVDKLLRAFTTRLNGPASGAPPGRGIGAPWSWSMNDEGLKREVEERLRAVGVTGELSNVGVGDEESDRIADEAWGEFLGTLTGIARR